MTSAGKKLEYIIPPRDLWYISRGTSSRARAEVGVVVAEACAKSSRFSMTDRSIDCTVVQTRFHHRPTRFLEHSIAQPTKYGFRPTDPIFEY